MTGFEFISFWFHANYSSFYHLMDRGVCHAWGMFILSGAPSTTSHLDILNMSILDYYILSIFHYLRSPLCYHTLIFDLMRNLYLYNAYIYFILYHVSGLTQTIVAAVDVGLAALCVVTEILPAAQAQLLTGQWVLCPSQSKADRQAQLITIFMHRWW